MSDEDHPELTPEEREEARRVSQSKLEQVRTEEEDISAAVNAAVEEAGGQLKRFETRFKSLDSLYRKVQDIMFDDETGAEDAVAEVRDALRYTVVVGESGYWAKGSDVGASLERAGYRRAKQSPGWPRFGYRGRNDSFISPEGLEFEVQIHTEASLDAAERAHVLYEQQRRATTPDDVKAQLDDLQNEIFAAVPAPDDVKWVD
ncbi:hypothetical protein [Mycolicibacterium sp. XJ1904]